MISTFFKKLTLGLVILFKFCGLAHSADRITGEDIKNIIIKRAQLDGVELSPIIANHKIFDACKTDIEVIPVFGDWKTTQVSCNDPYSWNLNIRSKISQGVIEAKPKTKPAEKATNKIIEKRQILTAVAPTKKAPAVKKILKKRTAEVFEYVVLREPATKGTILSDPKYFTTKSYKYKVRGGFTKTAQIIGRKLKASMPEGKPLLARHLAMVYIIEKNDIIDIVLNRSGIRVSSEGIALSNGQLGEIILVSNIDTGVKLKAKIKNSHEAEIITKQSR